MKIINALKNLKLRSQILTVLALPLLGMLWLGGTSLLDQLRLSNEMSQVNQLARYATHVGQLVHQIQRERGASALLLSSSNNNDRDALTAQRQRTDTSVQELKRLLERFDTAGIGQEFERLVQQEMQQLNQLGTLRAAVDNGQVSPSKSNARYTQIVDGMLHSIVFIATTTTNPKMATRILAYLYYLEAKERAGLERAVGAGNLAAGRFDAEQHQLFQRLVAEQNILISLANDKLPEGLSGIHRDTVRGSDVDEVLRIRDQIFNGGLTGDLGGFEGADWFRVATSRIDQMKQVEDRIEEDILAKAADLHRQARSALIRNGLLEIGAILLAVTLAVLLIRIIVSTLAGVAGHAERLAGGDLTVRLEAGGENEIGQLQNSIIRMTERLSNTIGEISNAADSLAAAAEESSAVTLQTSEGVHQQQQEVAQVSTATQQIASSVKSVAANTNEAAEQSQQLDGSAQTSLKELHEAVVLINSLTEQATETASAVERLQKGCQSIYSVLEVIRNISDQTNLLALNAAIEAARAGEHGRGFAVVADEVRTLSQHTQASTTDIGNMMERLQQDADQAVNLMQLSLEQSQRGAGTVQHAGECVEHMVRGVAGIRDMSTQIASAAEEQSVVLEEISQNIERISDIAVQTNAGAEETAATSQELARLAESLQQQVRQFTLD